MFQKLYRRLCRTLERFTLWLAVKCGNASYDKLWTAFDDLQLQYAILKLETKEELVTVNAHSAMLKRYCTSLKKELKLARELRILVKAAFSHNQNVRFVSRHEVKLNLQKDFYDRILEGVKALEDVNKEAHMLQGALEDIEALS